MERVLIDVLFIIVGIFCLWRGFIAVKTQTFDTASNISLMIYKKPVRYKGVIAIFFGIVLIILGCILFWMVLTKGLS